MRLPTIVTQHADDRLLLQYLDDDPRLSTSQRSHIANCPQCGVALDDIGALQERARSLRTPEPGDVMLARIHARIEAGESVILPLGPTVDTVIPEAVSVVGTLRGRVVALAVAAAAIFAIWLPRGGTDAQAGSLTGDLRFTPAAPRAGDTVTVEYRAPVMLQGEPRLRLRARFRTDWSDAYAEGIPIVSVGTLQRGRDGVHRGGFRLPRDVVYGAFAVEDTAARQVDSRNRRLWELLVADSAGRPSYDALRQRENEFMGRNSTLALETVRERVTLNPDDPAARATLRSFEGFNLGSEADAALPAHAKEWWRLHRLWSARGDVPFVIVNGMRSYAIQIADEKDSIWTAVRTTWSPRWRSAIAEERTDRASADARWGALNNSALRVRRDPTMRGSAVIALAQAERYWATSASRAAWAPTFGFQIATAVPDSTAAQLRWADRLVQRIPEQTNWRFGELARTPALRDVARQRLLARIETLRRRNDARRPLEFTVAEALRADSAEVRETLGVLAGAELMAGDTIRARATLSRATSAGWSTDLFRRAAQLSWATGDRKSAMPLLANIVVDPGTPAADLDSIARLVRGVIPAAAWEKAQARSRARMRDHFLATAISAPLPGPIPLRSATGDTSLSGIAASRASVVVFWSRFCGPSRDQMSSLDSLAGRLADLGAVLVPVTREPITAEVQAFLRKQQVTVPVYVDASGAAQRAFDQWATPEFFVMDANGVVRYRHTSLDLVLAQVAALRAQNDPPLIP
jgi:peroxiredoxin